MQSGSASASFLKNVFHVVVLVLCLCASLWDCGLPPYFSARLTLIFIALLLYLFRFLTNDHTCFRLSVSKTFFLHYTEFSMMFCGAWSLYTRRDMEKRKKYCELISDVERRTPLSYGKY